MVEAKCKQIYYSSFNNIILNKDFLFYKRTKNPPLDLINATMSYGYALLYGIIENDIYLSNLIVSLPFIHGVSRSKEGLQFDIGDIFKPVIIDRLIFRLINKKQLTKCHYDVQPNKVYLNKQGCKLFIAELEETLKTSVEYHGKKITYRSIIKNEVYAIEKSIISKKQYKGFKMKW